MNAVEIEEAVSDLAARPFDRAEFPFAFLAAFGNKETTIRRLRTPSANASDVLGGVLQRNNIHLATCDLGAVEATLAALRASVKTAANRVKFVLATDGVHLEAHDLTSDEPLSCPFVELDHHFGFLLPLAGISAVRQIKDNPIDVKATGRLNKLYVELLKDNPDWAREVKRHELNRFMARLVFCFFAEDTGIFRDNLFTATVDQMSEARGGQTNVDEVLSQLFLAMATPTQHEGRPDERYRRAVGVRPYADGFPYVNGGLFSDAGEVPRFSRMARTYLLRAGELHWQQINPDIFGSMIQAVAEDEERGSLGMHYTSVPNILKVLNPLFLDDLRAELEAAGDSVRKLRALRRRIAAIRVFDPACGSGNFLVIAYIQMREIERQIVERTSDEAKSAIPLTNFYGIEIKSFAAEIARLALLIAEFQCDSRMISQQAARSMVLPLHRTGQVHIGNALRMDWLEVCPPVAPVQEEWDLGGPTGRLALEETGLGRAVEAETYICGNPPYVGSQWRNSDQQADMQRVFSSETSSFRDLDYVACWFARAAQFNDKSVADFAFVATKSICQGIQVGMLWPLILDRKLRIAFAYRSFTWGNLAKANAGVTCVVVGISSKAETQPRIFDAGVVKIARNIGPYLLDMPSIIVRRSSRPLNSLPPMDYGNKPSDGGWLIIDFTEASQLRQEYSASSSLIRRYVGSIEFVSGAPRNCLWIEDHDLDLALSIPPIKHRIEEVARVRRSSAGKQSNDNAERSHRFVYSPHENGIALIVPSITSENRPFLPTGFVDERTVISNKAMAVYRSPTWLLAVIASRLHWVWIGNICVRMRSDFSYSNTLGYNTFPVPRLTDQDKVDLTACAETILLAREAHFPATIADLYDPEAMPDDLRRAHERNDETLERIYIGRRFRNDTERLEHLFKRYTEMTASDLPPSQKRASKKPRKAA